MASSSEEVFCCQETRTKIATELLEHQDKTDTESLNLFQTSSNEEPASNLLPQDTPTSYRCPGCDFASSSVSTLKRHIKVHMGDKPYSCSACEYKCASKGSLIVHLRIHSGEKPFLCPVCEYRTAQQGNLTAHMRNHKIKETFSCSACNYRTGQKRKLMKHMHSHKEYFYHCFSCNFKTLYKHHLARHVLNHIREPHHCSSCDFQTSRKNCLTRHVQIHHSDESICCSSCDFKTLSKHVLARHMQIHVNKKFFRCSTCNFESTDKCSLEEHMKTHSGEKTCKSNQLANLSTHMQTYDHGKEKSFSSLCDYRSTGKDNLINRTTTHTGRKCFCCSICDFKCAERRGLVKHMRIHVKESILYPCTICGFKSAYKRSLVMHMRIHKVENVNCSTACNSESENPQHVTQAEILTGNELSLCSTEKFKNDQNCNLAQHCSHNGKDLSSTSTIHSKKMHQSAMTQRQQSMCTREQSIVKIKGFSCTTCNFRSACSRDIIRHVRIHTGEKPFSCDMCAYRSSRSDTLLKHKRGIHKIGNVTIIAP